MFKLFRFGRAPVIGNAAVAPSGRPSGLWLDAPDAATQLEHRAKGDPLLLRIGRELAETGFTVLPGFQDPSLIDQAVRDYDRFIESNGAEAFRSRDALGRQFRLVNFHLASEAAMRLAKNPAIMSILDFAFGRKAAIHTSLTFQYSTEQELHRDAPYFHTFPESSFVGVWTALQDIHPDSGPLSYVPASHRFPIDQWALYRQYLEETKKPEIARYRALHDYQARVSQVARTIGPIRQVSLKKGDIAIWHPQLVHGGSSAINKALKRHSMVVHCCPADVYVFVDDVFLMHQQDVAPPPYYAYAKSLGRKHSGFGPPAFMNSI